MLRLRVLILASCVAVFGALWVHAQDNDLKAVLRKSIDAHGGADKLSKFKAATSKFKGTMDLMGQMRDIAGETSFQKPDKVKNSIDLDINGMQIPIIVVYDGKKMWVSTLGQTKEIDDDKVLKEMREGLQTEGAAGLIEFLDKPYELNPLGDVKVKEKDAIGIRVSKKGQRDFSLFIDKKTHLILKTETRSFDSTSGQEVTQEKFITAFRDTDGLKVASKLVIHKDGKLFMNLDISETKIFEKLDDSTFAMP